MFGRLTAAFLMFALLGTGLVAQPGTKDKGDKAEPAGVVGKVVSVDETKGTVTINVDGKNQTFTVKDDTAIVGPQGGVSKERLKDDRLVKGFEVTITPGTDPKVASKIKLDFRPRETKDTPLTKDAPVKDAKDAPVKDAKDTPVKDAKDKDKTTPVKEKDAPTKDKTTPVKDKDKTITPPKDKDKKTTTPVKDKK